ncbi:hypothetical protein KL86CLO1_13397 [uncultured Eubacteriales bacterium]|uniref:Uncharacterized protein n=1 Tax=uncultured Eubacteriales bacterium TaxID=172733 RepID=A0A212KJJ8_9FIRM|nr:hypothetical protein KL86CLO1_13397 [uncultured Eubacteriales bacterium]
MQAPASGNLPIGSSDRQVHTILSYN